MYASFGVLVCMWGMRRNYLYTPLILTSNDHELLHAPHKKGKNLYTKIIIFTYFETVYLNLK